MKKKKKIIDKKINDYKKFNKKIVDYKAFIGNAASKIEEINKDNQDTKKDIKIFSESTKKSYEKFEEIIKKIKDNCCKQCKKPQENPNDKMIAKLQAELNRWIIRKKYVDNEVKDKKKLGVDPEIIAQDKFVSAYYRSKITTIQKKLKELTKKS